MEDIEMKDDSDGNSSEYDNFDYNVEENEELVENIIDSKNIIVQNWITPEVYFSTKDAKEIILDNPLEYPINDNLLKKSPFELFIFAFEDILYKFVEYTNENAKEKYSININYDIDDIIKYIFVFLFLSVYNFHDIYTIWETTSNIISTNISKIITKDKFIEINKYFNIAKYSKNVITPNINKDNKLEKLQEFIEYINIKWKDMYPYSKFLTIDENMAAYKGKNAIKQYMKNKNKKFGIKLFTKTNSTNGYCYSVIPYTGKGFIYNKTLGLGASIVEELSIEHANKNKHITMDNFFMTMNSIIFLYNNKINFTGTITKNKKCFPQEIRNFEIKKNNKTKFKILNTSIYFYFIYDKKPLYLVSDKYGLQNYKYFNKKKKLKNKPEVVAYYNLTKSGCDIIDDALANYHIQRKSKKWWREVLFYLMDITLNNIYIIYKSSNKYHTTSHNNLLLYFRKTLLDEIYIYYNNEITNIKSNNNNNHEYIRIKYNNKYMTCDNCKKNKDKKGQRDYPRTQYRCNLCNMNLCKQCYENIHKY